MGRELRDRILAEYGSREALERRARLRRDPDAKLDLVDLRHFDEDPTRLDLEHRLTTIAILAPEELELLTPARLALLNILANAADTLNVSALASRLRRDKKNVSDDLRILERLGLVRIVRRGREALPRATGNRIEILLGGAVG